MWAHVKKSFNISVRNMGKDIKINKNMFTLITIFALCAFILLLFAFLTHGYKIILMNDLTCQIINTDKCRVENRK